MAIGTTGAVQTDENGNPIEDTRQTSSFNYTPVDPQEDMMRQAFERSQQAFNPPPPQPQGPTPYWENPATYYPRQQQPDPIAQAKAATMAAQKFIAFRGYQNDLKEGMSAQDAMARWAPMLFQDTSVSGAIKAVTPKPSYAYDQAHNMWTAPGLAPVRGNPIKDVPEFVPASGDQPAHYRIGNKIQLIPSAKPITMNEGDKISMTLAKERLNRAENVIEKGSGTPDEIIAAREQALMAKQEISDLNKRYGFAPSKYNPYSQKPAQDFGAMADAQAAPAGALGWKGGQVQAVQPSAPSAPIAMPKSKGDLVTGQKYLTSKGEATWDGSKFVK